MYYYTEYIYSVVNIMYIYLNKYLNNQKLTKTYNFSNI